MESTLTPREIQSRLRAGAPLADVAAAANVSVDEIAGFAGPVLAEREYIATLAQTGTLRKRDEGTGHRRLGDIVAQRVAARGYEAELLQWDAWRQPDGQWRVRVSIEIAAMPREAEFIFDAKRRFSTAANEDARWLIGEKPPGSTGPEQEPTVDLDDELALVRATRDADQPEVLPFETEDEGGAYQFDADQEDLDSLYEMLNVVSDDSVRIYTGLGGEEIAQGETPPEKTEAEPAEAQETEKTERKPTRSKRGKGRAKVPSWDEILFGGPAT
ncbi:MAG: hypothetical protein CSA64_01790 [Arachnia propionica]|nr:MAG: hypothetical protein CSA64_01790 [Arachnia propionica]